MKTVKSAVFVAFGLVLTGCGDISEVGKVPAFTPIASSNDYYAMNSALPESRSKASSNARASLWHSGPTSLLGDRRAGHLGDLLTVVIEINDKAEISNSSKRSRSGKQNMSVPQMMGIPQRIDQNLPEGATMSDAVDLSSSGSSAGDGSVRRNEKLTLRVAATVTGVLANGHLKIEGSQEVRVNYELRELLVTGFVRPEDISRKNEITYDKIASARISYGGRGQISQVQQPRVGQQVLDIILPF
ncbi:MAG: flagellar basal body L-ring protein FlgH [Rhodobacteraceae bacterium]|nr:flagellar basal body L-ring protein FlgH [Paracoccaceae bacterium]